MIEYLDHKGITYTVGPAKNVSPGWIGIRCPMPGCGDRSNHCGIRMDDLHFSCFVCGETGDVVKLIEEIEQCSRGGAYEIARRFRLSARTYSPTVGEPTPRSNRYISGTQLKPFSYPRDVVVYGEPTEAHVNYLYSRGFDPYQIWKTYKLKATTHLGRRFRYRIIIPVFYNGQQVSFTSRDITGRQRDRYLHLPDDESSAPIESFLYNYDSIQQGGVVILVEGVTDVWKIGSGACCAFGTDLTNEQLLMLAEKEVRKVFILLDFGAERQALNLKHKLYTILPEVEILKLSKGDPASSLTRSNLIFLRNLMNE